MGHSRGNTRPRRYLLALFLLAPSALADDARLILLVQPLPPEEATTQNYAPLARYLEEVTARKCTLESPPTFPAYWEAVRRGAYDVAFDAPHFTDYRVQKLGFRVVAKTRDLTSYSLIARGGVIDPAKLIGKRIASLGLLGAGTLRLNALFPNPLRQPVLVDVESTEEGVNLIAAKKVEAAFLPTALLTWHLPRPGITLVLSTEPLPRFALSVSPRLPQATAESIRRGLLGAHETDAGRAMLKAIGVERFEAANAEEFTNQSYVLRGYWGY